jgi:hypothetical protein
MSVEDAPSLRTAKVSWTEAMNAVLGIHPLNTTPEEKVMRPLLMWAAAPESCLMRVCVWRASSQMSTEEVAPEPAPLVRPELTQEVVPEPAPVSPSLKKRSTRRRQKPLMPSEELAQRKPTKLISTKGNFCRRTPRTCVSERSSHSALLVSALVSIVSLTVAHCSALFLAALLLSGGLQEVPDVVETQVRSLDSFLIPGQKMVKDLTKSACIHSA